MTAISYRPEIDGLRAFAVVPVILFHMGFKWVAGGYIGVDVFFVISGFLITSILKKDIAAGTFTFRKFWARRIRRILPAMIVVIGTTLAVAYLLLFKSTHPGIGQQATSALLSFANIYFWRTTGDYWGLGSGESPLLHTWSLSVEEQFYLFFPVVIWLILRLRPRMLKAFLLVVIVLSFLVFIYGSAKHPTATFYLLPTRAWELATGCYLSVILNGDLAKTPMVRKSALLSLSGLCMVAGCYVFVPILNGWVSVAVLGTALVIAFARSGICYNILAQRYVVHVGKMSYSLYLWHWPVLVFADYFGCTLYKWALFIPIYLLATVSYYVVEKPVRHLAGKTTLIVACYLLVLGASFFIAYSSPFYDTSRFNPATWIPYDCNPHPEPTASHRIRMATTLFEWEVAPPDAYLQGGIIVGSGESDPKLVVLGDSHGCMWADPIALIAKELNIKASFYCMAGVSPFVSLPLRHDQSNSRLTAEEKYNYDKTRLDLIRQWHPQLVIVCTPWSYRSEAQVSDLFLFLEEHASKVLLLEQPPALQTHGHNAMQYLCSQGVFPEDGVQKYLPIANSEVDDQGRQLIRELANRYRNVDVVPTYDLFSDGPKGLVLDGRNIVYLDADHLVSYGAKLVVPRLQLAISRIFEATEQN